MLNINKRTKSSIEWLVYKPGLRRKSGEDLTTTLFKSREGLASSKRCRIGREHSFPCIGGRGL